MDAKQVTALCDQIRETAYAIHQFHGNGYLEKVYENALAHRLRKAGLDVKQQRKLIIYDEDGTEIGEYFADLFVENSLIVELKATKVIAEEHKAQLLHYLKGSKIAHGLLINFGSYKFFIQKFIKSDHSPEPSSNCRFCLLPFFAIFEFFRG